jgi:hypothetical protein
MGNARDTGYLQNIVTYDANDNIVLPANLNVGGAAIFSSSVTASSLIKSGGTSSQYLMADGSTSTLTNPVTGTGTSGQVAYFTGTSSISSESNLFWDATNNRLGINNAIPITSLDVVGRGQFSNSEAGAASLSTNNSNSSDDSGMSNLNFDGNRLRLGVLSTDSSYGCIGSNGGNTGIAFVTNNTTWSEKMRLTSDGKLLIGTQTDAGFKLDVNGTARFSDNVNLTYNKAIIGRNVGNTLDITLIGVFAGLDKVYIDPSAYGTILGGALSVTGAANFSSSVTAVNAVLGNTSNNTNAIQFLDAASSKGHIGNGFGATFINNNSFYNGSVYVFDDNTKPNSQVTLTAGTVVLSTGAANVDPTPKVTILNNGNVGIGTTSPVTYGTRNLEVNGGAGTAYIVARGSNNAGVIEIAFDGDGYIGTKTAHNLVIRTNDVQRINIFPTSGNVLIGTGSDNGSKLQVIGAGTFSGGVSASGVNGFSITANGAGANGISEGPFIRYVNTTNSYQILKQINANTDEDTWTIRGGGWNKVGNLNATTGVYTALSDRNKKKDFEESTIGLNAILGLKPTLYRMKDQEETERKQLGFIAQEVKDYIPQAYVEQDNFIGLQDRPIVAALVKAVQELKAELDELKSKN